MAVNVVAGCTDTTVRCIEACEKCATECGTSVNKDRELCALLARDCADIGSLSLALMSRGSRYVKEICAVHAKACDACAEMCARFPTCSCCKACMDACRACAVECRACC